MDIDSMIGINEYLDFDAPEASHQAALSALASNFNFSILGLLIVPEMSNALTSSQEKLRYRAALLLAELLDRTVALDGNSCHTLLAFFCSRIADYPSLVPCLRALRSIVEKYGDLIDAADILLIFKSLFQEVSDVQSLAQSVRQKFFELLLALLTRQSFIEYSQPLGEDIIKGTVTAVYGEKDPRCLVLSLQLLHLLLRHYKSHMRPHMIPDVFEAFACYFPITFTPPIDDPYGITAEDLVAPLQNCLCCHEKFLDTSLPFLLDQLTADSLLAGRTQALDCFIRIASIHSIDALKAILGELAQELHSLVANTSTDSALCSKTLQAVTELSRALSREITASKLDNWELFGRALLEKVMEGLAEDAEGVQAVAGIRVAVAMASASSAIASAVLSAVVPLFTPMVLRVTGYIEQSAWADETAPSPKSLQFVAQLLQCIDPKVNYGAVFQSSGFVHSLIQMFAAMHSVIRVSGVSLKSAKATLLLASCIECSGEICVRAETMGLEESLVAEFVERCTDIAVIGLAESVTQPPSSAELNRAVHALRNAARSAVVHVSSGRKEVFIEPHCVRRVKEHLGDSGMTIEDIEAACKLLSSLCQSHVDTGEVLSLCSPVLLAFLDVAQSNSVLAVIHAYSDILGSDAFTVSYLLAKEVLKTVLAKVLTSSGTSQNSAQLQMSLSHLISRTLSLVDMNVHEVAVIDLTDVLLLGGLEGSDGCLKASIGAFIFASVANSSEESSLSKSMSELAQLAVAALESSNGSMSSECQSREYIEAIAVAVNKMAPGYSLESLLLKTLSLSTSSSADVQARVLLLLTLCRSVFMREELSIHQESAPLALAIFGPDANMKSWQSALCSYLISIIGGREGTSQEYANCVCRNWGSLFEESEANPLSYCAHVKKSGMWKQKLWHRVFPFLVQMQQQNSPSCASSLICICSMISGVSNQTFVSMIPDPGHLVAKAFALYAGGGPADSSQRDDLKYSGLDALDVLLQFDPTSISNFVNSLIPLLLNVSSTDAKPKKRAAALQCLLSFVSSLNYSTIFPFKARVIKGLSKAVDDPKRRIRQLASKVRNKWICLSI